MISSDMTWGCMMTPQAQPLPMEADPAACMYACRTACRGLNEPGIGHGQQQAQHATIARPVALHVQHNTAHCWDMAVCTADSKATAAARQGPPHTLTIGSPPTKRRQSSRDIVGVALGSGTAYNESQRWPVYGMEARTMMTAPPARLSPCNTSNVLLAVHRLSSPVEG